MQIPTKFEYLFGTPGAKRWLTRDRGPRQNAIFPLTYKDTETRGYTPDRFVYARDPRMLRITEKVATRLTDEFPQDVTPSGFSGPTAVPGNFYSALSVSGCGMDPLPLPLVDNAKFIESLGLRSDIRKQDIPYLKTLIRLYFGHVTPTDLHIRKEATTSLLLFTKDNEWKKMTTLHCLRNCDEYINRLSGGRSDLTLAMNDFHSLLVNAIHERQQPTPITKEEDGTLKAKARRAPSEEEARTGSLKASFEADFRVFDDAGGVIPNHFAMRRRVVWGFSGIPNYFMTAIMGCHRSVYLNRFAFTYKTRGWEDKEQRISQYRYIVGSDVKNMDTTLPTWFFEFLLKELEQYWDERLLIVLRRMLYASFVAPPPWRETPDSYNPVFGGDPLDGEANVHAGLTSGIFINPDLGKLWMTFVYLILYRDSGAISSIDEIEPFLQGKNPNHGLLNMSDDATMMTNSSRVYELLKRAKSPYAVLEPETPVIYLGDVFAMDGGKKRAYPNPVTYIVNPLARESSMDNMNPISYAEGVLARFQHYSRTPIFRDLNRIYEEEIRNELGINPYLIARAVAKRQRFTEVDAIVKANPHYLVYRIDPADVSKEVLDEIVATIPASDFFNSIRHLFKVPTVELGELVH
jgi:hypothetical protein